MDEIEIFVGPDELPQLSDKPEIREWVGHEAARYVCKWLRANGSYEPIVIVHWRGEDHPATDPNAWAAHREALVRGRLSDLQPLVRAILSDLLPILTQVHLRGLTKRPRGGRIEAGR